ncbi:MAG: hypothetical protein JNL98_45130, partial [Bryobacterales bacterium]|nr:hypothetical protein [Bryobacterales bacterium]
QLFPWGGGLEELPAAHAAAIVFDLAVVGLLYLCGRPLRGGREGRDLGIALAFAWLAYPYTLYALNANGGNDAFVAALLVAALLAIAAVAAPFAPAFATFVAALLLARFWARLRFAFGARLAADRGHLGRRRFARRVELLGVARRCVGVLVDVARALDHGGGLAAPGL